MRQELSVRRTLVGAMLRQYREAHGYTLDDAARTVECDRSKISRVETGQRGIRPKELRELLTEYDVDHGTQDVLAAITKPGRSNGQWQGLRKILPDAYLDFMVTASAASSIKVYAPLRVPEMLWTREYGSDALVADRTVPEGSEVAAVDAVIAQCGAPLFSRQPDCTIVIGEAALRHQIGSSDVMRDQFARLLELCGTDCPWLSIRVLPFSVGAHAAGGLGAFSVLSFDQAPDLGVVHLAGAVGGVCLDDRAAITAYTDAFTRMGSYTLTLEQTRVKFRELAERQE